MSGCTPTPMTEADFPWAAQLMRRRRERYAQYSPVFWRPAPRIVEFHAQFLRYCSTREGAQALRTEGGFIIMAPNQGRCFVDDFAVEEESLWASEGKKLLLAAWQRSRGPTQRTLRVVTARRDEAKRQLSIDLGLTVNARVWVKELTPSAPPRPPGPITLDVGEAQLVNAPPVYDPGGPVCLLGDLDPSKAAAAAEQAAAAGAVLAIVQREGGDDAVAASEPLLEAAGYHTPAEFYQGRP
jgi:hypothetical protein